MIPEWMEENDAEGNGRIKNNGVWTNTHLNIPELIGTFMKVWLEDTVPQDLLDGMESTKNVYTPEKQKEAIENVYGAIVKNRVSEFNNVLEQITETAQ